MTTAKTLLVGLFALMALAALPAVGAADGTEGCAIPEAWECDDSSHAVPDAFIVVFHDWIEEDPGDIAREHVEQNGGVLGFVYRHGLKGYSVSQLSEAGAKAISADPRVAYVGRDHYVCAAAEVEGGCAADPLLPPGGSGGGAGPPIGLPELPAEAAVFTPPTASQGGQQNRGKRCRRGKKRLGRRCGRRPDRFQDRDSSQASTSPASRSGGKTG